MRKSRCNRKSVEDVKHTFEDRYYRASSIGQSAGECSRREELRIEKIDNRPCSLAKELFVLFV